MCHIHTKSEKSGGIKDCWKDHWLISGSNLGRMDLKIGILDSFPPHILIRKMPVLPIYLVIYGFKQSVKQSRSNN